MKSETPLLAPDFSSSELTVVSVHCEATLELGKKLVRELGLNESVDTLGRWMAHYISELIQDAEKASSEEKPAKMKSCYDAILNLWQHRHALSNGSNPFEEIEPIINALKSLDPEDDKPRYFRSLRTWLQDKNDNNEPNSWLELADKFDESAKMLIRYCILQASETSLDKSVEWAALAEAAGANDGIELPVIHLLADEKKLLSNQSPNDRAKQILENRIANLEDFINQANELASEMRRSLQQNSDSPAD